MRIGILGGSFNPVHKDHYLLASYIKDVLSLDKFLIIPNATPPHKNTCHISFDDRVKMLSLASFDKDVFEISDVEKDLNYEVKNDLLIITNPNDVGSTIKVFVG